MRIVTCITRLIHGGAQRIALETAAFLTARGHDAPLWCGPETGPEGSLHREAENRGVRIRIFPHLRRAVHPWHDALALADLVHALRTERPDLLHTHSSKAGILGREAARRTRVPRVVHTVHGWGFTPRTPGWMIAGFVALERRCAPVGPMVFVNPGDREAGLLRGIVPHPKSRIIPPGIDLAPYEDETTLRETRREMRRSLGLPDEAVVAGFLGRLSDQKAPEILLDVAAATARSERELHWLVVGDGPMAASLRRRAGATPPLAGRVHWAGLQTDAHRWLAAMDLLLLPSRWEGTPLTLMEAMAAGLPVIASDLPGVRWVLEGLRKEGAAPGDAPRDARRAASEAGPEVIFELPTGLLAPIADVPRFASAVERLVRDPRTRATLGATARTLALERFGLDVMVERLLNLYTLGAGPSGARGSQPAGGEPPAGS
jgi:glycosyltransferase involved in cell wall biosynthesis